MNALNSGTLLSSVFKCYSVKNTACPLYSTIQCIAPLSKPSSAPSPEDQNQCQVYYLEYAF